MRREFQMKLSREAWRRAYRAIEASTKGDASILSEGREVISATCKASTEVEIEVEWPLELFVLLRREIDNPAMRCPEFENVTRACEFALKEEHAGEGTTTEPGT